MAYNRNHVNAFMNAAEAQLFATSVGPALKELGTADLKRRLVRARTLRDKNRDLLRRQKLKTQARTGYMTGIHGTANERTGKKAVAFDEALKRFEAEAAAREKRAKTSAKKSAKKSTATKQSAPTRNAGKRKGPGMPAAKVLRQALEKKRDAASGRADAAPTRSTKATSTGPAGASAPFDGVRPTPPSVRAAAVESRLEASNLKPIQGHTSTQVRHAQAKRDSRG